jgi:DNA-binding Xre family transcriptional regulator
MQVLCSGEAIHEPQIDESSIARMACSVKTPPPPAPPLQKGRMGGVSQGAYETALKYKFMPHLTSPDHTAVLQTLMQHAGVPSFRALSEKAGISRWQVQQLRQGKVKQMRLAVLSQLATALEISTAELLAAFGVLDRSKIVSSGDDETAQQVVALQQEYARLQTQMERQAEQVRSQFQTESLQILESWLRYWPTAAQAATEDDQFSARKLLPLVKPVEKLMADWGVMAVVTVGEIVPYDSQQHQLIKGTANPGDLVQVRYTGYRHQGRLLFRAQVTPLEGVQQPAREIAC